jgi:hypothetical protein
LHVVILQSEIMCPRTPDIAAVMMARTEPL